MKHNLCYSCNTNIASIIYCCPYLHELKPRGSKQLSSDITHNICRECLINYTKMNDILLESIYCPFYKNACNTSRIQ